MAWKKCRTQVAICNSQVKVYFKNFAYFFSILFLLVTAFIFLHSISFFVNSLCFVNSCQISFGQWVDNELQIALKKECDDRLIKGLFFWEMKQFTLFLEQKYSLADPILFSIDQDLKSIIVVQGPQFLCQVNQDLLFSMKGLLYDKKKYKQSDLEGLPFVKIDISKCLNHNLAVLVEPLSFFLQQQEWQIQVNSLSEIVLTSTDKNKKYSFLYEHTTTNSFFLSLPSDFDDLLKTKKISLKKDEHVIFDMRFGSYIVVEKIKKWGSLL